MMIQQRCTPTAAHLCPLVIQKRPSAHARLTSTTPSVASSARPPHRVYRLCPDSHRLHTTSDILGQRPRRHLARAQAHKRPSSSSPSASTSTPRAHLSHAAEDQTTRPPPRLRRGTSNLAKRRSRARAFEAEAEGSYNAIPSARHMHCLQSPPPHRAEDQARTPSTKSKPKLQMRQTQPGQSREENAAMKAHPPWRRARKATPTRKRRGGVHISGAGGQSDRTPGEPTEAEK
ncbi:hypothetical protein B0H16DRAFT_1691986 [Mycena metata]|uniref:Uncharacterized protein n=1 Tax=Mycena metata TaxID=1033252 RepID=A0AAD7N6K8_9AGAR|nr:hypothetical protein B0H16DRAFT_1691986 [Mycena metata]